jgi:hypothetical protein
LVPVLLALGAASAAAQPGTDASGSGYETPTALRASEVLPPELVSGPHHRVQEEVRADGLHRVFSVDSPFGHFEARGEDELRARIREIEATAKLRETNQVPVQDTAVGKSPRPGGLAGWVIEPGAGERPTGAPRAGLVDLDAMKRQVAHELGIDPYTENEALQRELERHVFSTFASGRASRDAVDEEAPPEPAPSQEQTDEEAPEEGDRAAELVRDYSQEDLERLHRIELAVMGVEEELREEFLDNPWYNPRDGTQLVDALSSLEGTEGRSAFIEAAIGAGSAAEARSFQRMAELMRRYSSQVGSLERFTRLGGRVAAYAEDGTLVVPVEADHALWTPNIASFAAAIARAAGEDPEVAKTRLLVSGKLSARARREIQGLGIDVTEHALESRP